jgi:hypothetical protein
VSVGNAFKGSAASRGNDGARRFKEAEDVEEEVRRAGGISSEGAMFKECKSTVSRKVMAASYPLA